MQIIAFVCDDIFNCERYLQLFRLMSQQDQSNRKNVVHYPYFRRNDTIDAKLDAYKIPRHKYTLLGIARNDTYGADIFLHYFQSYYTKQYDRSSAKNTDKLQKTQVSQFFWIFIKIKALRNLVSINRNITGLVGMTVRQIFSPLASESEKKLVSLIKNEVSQIYQEQSDRILKIKKGQYLEIAAYIENKIDTLLSNFYQKIKRPQFFQYLKQTQYLQEQFNDSQNKQLICKNLESIRNLQIYCRSIKKDIWQQFYNTHKGYMPLRIPFIMDSQRNIDNTIILPKYTQEANYIMAKMLAYLNFKIPERKSASFHSSSLQLSKEITQICSNYHKQTKKYYPSLSLDCIFFDQKKLVPVLSYSSILQDAIGIKRNSKNVQLTIATEPTPFFNIEQSYLQTTRQNQILSNRKYYSPLIRQKREDWEGHVLNLKKQENFMQKTHVWRLIQIIYYIKNHRYFANDFYNQRFSKTNAKDSHPLLPFYNDQYKKMLKSAFESFQQGKLTIQQIIPKRPISKNKNNSPHDSQNSSKFTLDLYSMKKYLNILDEDDSLLQSFKFQKTKNLISERFMLMKEFNILLLHPQFFKKMINPKKYYLIYFLHCYDQVFLKKVIRDKEKEIIEKEWAEMEQIKSKKIRQEEDFYNFLYFGKKELMEQLQKYIFNANLSKDIQKRRTLKNDTQKKLSEYHGRKDMNGDYVRKQIEYYNSIFEIKSIFNSIQMYQSIQKNATLYQNSSEILNYFLTLNTSLFQTDQKLKQYIFQCKNINQKQKGKESLNGQAQENFIEIYKHLNGKIETNISTLLEKLKNVINKFVTNEVLEDFKIPQKLHELSSAKSDKQTWTAICNYKNTRFKVLIESLYNLNESLLINYKSYYNLLIEESGVFEQKVNKIQPSQIISMTNNILLFRKNFLKLKSPSFIV